VWKALLIESQHLFFCAVLIMYVPIAQNFLLCHV